MSLEKRTHPTNQLEPTARSVAGGGQSSTNRTIKSNRTTEKQISNQSRAERMRSEAGGASGAPNERNAESFCLNPNQTKIGKSGSGLSYEAGSELASVALRSVEMRQNAPPRHGARSTIFVKKWGGSAKRATDEPREERTRTERGTSD